MDELHEFCARILGDRDAAARVIESVRTVDGRDRLAQVADAVLACRSPATEGIDVEPPRSANQSRGGRSSGASGGLAEAVAAELAAATGGLPQRQREALGLKELLGLSHGELAVAIGIPAAAVAPLLARARLGLRDALRGAGPPAGECDERERALRALVLRQDSEPMPSADGEWLVEHLGHCPSCVLAHSAMLESSACYRTWPAPDRAATSP